MKTVAVFITFGLFFHSRQSGAQLSCESGSGGDCPMRSLCPDDKVSFTCDVKISAGITVWSFSTGTCDLMHNRIILIHSSDRCPNASSVCGPFTAENCDPGKDQHCTISRLNFDLSKVANGTLIQCINNSLLAHIEVGNATIMKAVKPGIKTSFAECTSDSVTLTWKQDTDNEYNYELSATPPVENCDPNCTVQVPSTTVYKFTGLKRGMKYNLTVQASNCAGTTEDRETVYIPKSPPLLWNGPMCKTYSNTSLSAIYSSWQPAPPILLNEESPPCVSVFRYVITYESDTGEQVNTTVLPSECSSGECSHAFTLPVDGSASQYNVFVTAVGLGVTSDKKIVGKINNILLAEVNTTSAPVMATCSFLSEVKNDVQCRVDYGTSPDSLEYSATSQQMGSAGENVTVELTLNGAALLPSTTYYYTAALESPCVKVEGQFTTGENSIDAVPPDEESSKAGAIAGGVVAGVVVVVVAVVILIVLVLLVIRKKRQSCDRNNGSQQHNGNHELTSSHQSQQSPQNNDHQRSTESLQSPPIDDNMEPPSYDSLNPPGDDSLNPPSDDNVHSTSL